MPVINEEWSIVFIAGYLTPIEKCNPNSLLR